MTSLAGSPRRRSTVLLPVAMMLGLLAGGCAGQGSAEQMNAPVSIGTKNTNLLIENRSGQTLNDVHLTVVPGLMLVLCVLGINVFGDGARDALDPRAQVRLEH